MDPYLLWIIAGFGLVIVELLTGTFYLLVLGIAAFGAAAMAYFGLSFPVQSITAVVVASVGAWLVHLYRVKNSQQQMRSMDYGQAVIFEEWMDQGAGMARVRYRGALWEAQVEGDRNIGNGATLYIHAVKGNTLTISKTRPDK